MSHKKRQKDKNGEKQITLHKRLLCFSLLAFQKKIIAFVFSIFFLINHLLKVPQNENGEDTPMECFLEVSLCMRRQSLPPNLIPCYMGSSGSGHTKAGIARLITAGKGGTGLIEGCTGAGVVGGHSPVFWLCVEIILGKLLLSIVKRFQSGIFTWKQVELPSCWLCSNHHINHNE